MPGSAAIGAVDNVRNDLEHIWQDGQRLWREVRDARNYVSLACNDHRFRPDDPRLSASKHNAVRVNRIQAYLEELISRPAEDAPESYFRFLDAEIGKLFDARFNGPSEMFRGKHVVTDALNVISRLPATPPEVYFSQEPWVQPTWDSLPVVSRLSTVTLKVALACTTANYAATNNMIKNIGLSIRLLLDYISEFVDILEQLKGQYQEGSQRDHLNLLQSFLWSTWSRCLLLLFWAILGVQIGSWEEAWSDFLGDIRGISLLSPSFTHDAKGPSGLQYMCTWAHELLRGSRGGVGSDFRYFHQRFAELHGHKSARCLYGSDEPCDGEDPLRCGRFADKRLVAEEQSVHVCDVNKCMRVKWNQESYLSIKGPVAASLSGIFNRRIAYIKASSRTMAISHVWSHGHGGRPSSGINKCLHKQFSRLAKANGCDSYWIDTVCIPEDHNLRKEAIGYINKIFTDSRLVLILDRDLMQIEANRLSVDAAESILTTFLVCDWSVRAWTMLEAIKGRQGLHILCKNQKIWPLQDILRIVHSQGRIDLAIVSLAMPVLFPTERAMHAGNYSFVEAAANILSNRHATREGDDIIIWSLLSDLDVHDSAAKFWKAQIGRTVKTAFLMSSAPRIQNTPGLSWAPSTPYIRQYDANKVKIDCILSCGDGGECMEAEITNEGLYSPWLLYDFEAKDGAVFESAQVNDHGNQRRIPNPCWTRARHLSASFAKVVLIQPLLLVDRTAISQGEFHAAAFAICTSQDGKVWQWDTVQKWPMAVRLPPLKEGSILIG